MDAFDKKILKILQNDCTASVSDVADQVGLSTTPCWRRIQAMEKSGIIKGRVALADPEKLNVGLTVFVTIKTNQHNPKWLSEFRKVAEDFPRNYRILPYEWRSRLFVTCSGSRHESL